MGLWLGDQTTVCCLSDYLMVVTSSLAFDKNIKFFFFAAETLEFFHQSEQSIFDTSKKSAVR